MNRSTLFRISTLLLIVSLPLIAQTGTRIDSSVTVIVRKPPCNYSLYIPAGWDINSDTNAMMVSIHPWNGMTAINWCDRLMDFAEQNKLLLVCPQGVNEYFGGDQAEITELIDTALVSVLIKNLKAEYGINNKKVFLMGYSWGGLRTYNYGLSNPQVFAGFIPLGAFVTSANKYPITAIASNAEGKPFYLIHGSEDTPQVSYFGMITLLQENNALVNSILLDGVTHSGTIGIPDFEEVLSVAYNWVDSVSSATPVFIDRPEQLFPKDHKLYQNYPNPFNPRTTIRYDLPEVADLSLSIYDIRGRLVSTVSELSQPAGTYEIQWNGTNQYGEPVSTGVYLARIQTQAYSKTIKMLFLK
ncbi:MAG: T9SS type A sorting domain-containing protein [Candidatus Marinimicrobia bacterium]|nr:T9SS type A sorting domain-containing protein [Candidatus Neomarinimicrobiota bacterium]